MKLRLTAALVFGALFVQAHANQPIAATPAAPATTLNQAAMAIPKITVDNAKVSYGIGMDLGMNFKAQGIEVDPNLLMRGLKDAISDAKPLYTQQELATTLSDFQKQLMAKRQAEITMLGLKNAQQSANFLKLNKTKPGVVTTASGLQYKIINAGKGTVTATDTDNVTVDYEGSLPNGQIFDSSYKRGKPVTFPVTQVIPGWTEALKLMKTDATFEVYVPANLAYGDRGMPPVIGPNQALIFKIHLISSNKNTAPKA